MARLVGQILGDGRELEVPWGASSRFSAATRNRMTLRASISAGFEPLRLVFRPTPPATPSQSPEPLPDAAPEVDFVAYAEDCVLSGRVELAADRLSDLINAHEQLELSNVLVEALTGGSAFEVRDLAIRRDEVLVVHATGPRGRRDRRQRTRQHPIVAKVGPYEVRGYVHALPGADPIASLRRRRPMVPLTDAVIEYVVGPDPIRRRVSTLLFNRELADWIVEGGGEEDPLDGFVMPSDEGPLVKDFTGDILGWATEEGAEEPEERDMAKDRDVAGAA
jgi:hypothetical protein